MKEEVKKFPPQIKKYTIKEKSEHLKTREKQNSKIIQEYGGFMLLVILVIMDFKE